MATKIFLDTNIIVDYFDINRANHLDAKKIIASIEKHNIEGFISESVINTSVYLLQKGFAFNDLRDNMDELVSMLFVLPCTNNTIRQAYRLPTTDLEDAVLYQLAFENNLDYFITSDKKDFKKLSSVLLPVITSKSLMKILG